MTKYEREQIKIYADFDAMSYEEEQAYLSEEDQINKTIEEVKAEAKEQGYKLNL